MLAYSLFTLAALHAMLMMAAERSLHRGRLPRIIANLPPLMTMEALLFRLIHIAFVLLTLTLLSGIFFSEALFGKALTFNHKTVFALLSWLIFAGLLIGPSSARLAWTTGTALDAGRLHSPCFLPTSAAASCSKCCSAAAPDFYPLWKVVPSPAIC